MKVFGEEQPCCYETLSSSPWPKSSACRASARTASARARTSPGRTTSTSGWWPTWPPTATRRCPMPTTPRSKLFLESRSHLPKSGLRSRALAEDRAAPHWREGGLRAQPGRPVPGLQGHRTRATHVANKYGKLINLYQEKTAGYEERLHRQVEPRPCHVRPRVDTTWASRRTEAGLDGGLSPAPHHPARHPP
ncbi:MAG: hypothetical protein MZW92_25530 [Comamonadaceae bacterium]|nr:hypothetical protein [Comamonadaceae bacterium]